MGRVVQHIRNFFNAFRASKPEIGVPEIVRPLSDAEYNMAVEVEKHAQGKGMGSG